MARGLAVVTAILLVVASCGDSVAEDSAAVGESAPTAAAPVATAVPTTAAAVVPPATPTAVTVPTAAAGPVATALPATPTTVPTSTVAPTAVQAPATPREPSQPAQPTASASAESQEILATNGGETYGIACARCHGENGTGAIGHPGLIGAGGRYSTAAMIDELTNGHRITFGFADTLSADEIAAVVAYVKATFPAD